MKQKSSFRRFVCLLLTLAMLLSLGTTALAASPALLLHYDFAGDEGAAVRSGALLLCKSLFSKKASPPQTRRGQTSVILRKTQPKEARDIRAQRYA